MTSGATNDFDLSHYGSDILTREELIERSKWHINNRSSTNRRVFKINVTNLKPEEVEDFIQKIKEKIKINPNE